jgi:small subunit ribosomal protein S20
LGIQNRQRPQNAITATGEFSLPAKKAGRQQIKNAQRNRSAKTETRTIVARANRSLNAGDTDAAEPAVMLAIRTMDRAVRKGILHKNNAARRKSRMMAKYSRLGQTTEA